MSLIFCDGFDDGLLTQKWNLLTGTAIATGRNGNALRISGATNGVNKASRQVAAADEHATFTVGFAYYPTNARASDGTGFPFLRFSSDAGVTSHVSMLINADGTITAKRGASNGVILGTSLVTTLITLNQWQYVEAMVTLSDTVGVVHIKINGTSVLNLTAQDTKNAGTKAVLDTFAVGAANSNTATDYSFYDDLYVTNGAGALNTGFLGDIAIETLLPNGNGTTNQWVGSDGNSVDNYLLVDEATPSSIDYNESSTSGNRDLYAMANLTRTTGTIYGAIANPWAGNADAGAQNIKHVCKSGATTNVGSSTPVTTTYVPLPKVYETDPNTAAAWSVANLNAAEFGVEVA